MDAGLMDFIGLCEDDLKSKQSIIDPIKNDVMEYVQEKFVKSSGLSNILLHGRVKHPDSLREKIIRKDYYDTYKECPADLIKNLPDLIGLRLVCLLADEEINVYRVLKDVFSERINDDDYFIIPGSNGGKHLKIFMDSQPKTQKNNKDIYRINCKWIVPGDSEINVELQIKSLIHMFWGEIEHMLFYKNYSYIIGANFYRQIMDSTYDMLKLVDFQLKIMKSQLNTKDESEQIDEIKEMLAKLIYNNYGPLLKDLLNCEIDLREVYYLIVKIYFQRVTSLEDAYNRTDTILSQLKSFYDLRNTSFIFENYEVHRSQINEVCKPLSITISLLAKSSDVFWKTLVGIYMFLTRPNNFTVAVDDISVRLMSYFLEYRDSIEHNDSKVANIFNEGVMSGIICSFNSYKKLEFFLIRHTSKINSILIKYVENNDDFFDIEERELAGNEDNLKNTISMIISMLLNAAIDRDTLIADLIKFKNLLEKDLPWKPTINNELLERYVRTDKNINSIETSRIFEIGL